MKILIVGLGVQGKKRKKLLKKNIIFATVDPKDKSADYKNIKSAPVDKYDTVFVCTPDSEKIKILNYCIKHKKNALIEKPLVSNSIKKIKNIEKKANNQNLVFYSAYNHRFEPHFIRIKNIINSGILGKIYYCHMFYGNGTARLVRNQKWRDKGLGVIQDLGPHLLDTMKFWFNQNFKFNVISKNKFENKSPDHAILLSKKKNFHIKLGMSMCMWKNSLICNIIGSKGSIHLDSLCKWGPSTLTICKRKFPSGYPQERKINIKMKDPTWDLEHDFFFRLIKLKKKMI
jgi:scyllo-inositol 2-dehydrogenase (NADP+)